MVTILLSGGLGNQLFQYAAAKALAIRLNTSLVLDVYSFAKKGESTARHFQLDIFGIEASNKSTCKTQLFLKAYPFIKKHDRFFLPWGFLCDKAAMHYNTEIETVRGNVSMCGYFQNEQYFTQIAAAIRHDFSFTKPLEGRNAAILLQMQGSQSVAIHIRRGDYISNANAASNFAVCSLAYYTQAIAHIANRVHNVHFFVFSDDMDWVREQLTFGGHKVSYVDWNRDADSYIDLQLMSLCQHIIIANSSFSWWAAWLNANPHKMVLAPSKWFKKAERNTFLADFYPKDWTVIEG